MTLRGELGAVLGGDGLGERPAAFDRARVMEPGPANLNVTSPKRCQEIRRDHEVFALAHACNKEEIPQFQTCLAVYKL
jgi:hypothetical protein